MTKPWLSLSVVVGLVFMLATPAWADYQAAGDAYNRGDYDTALKEWRPLAEQGEPVAQNNLGTMYSRGQGVPQDYQEAIRWYRLAAEQRVASAQYNLGLMFFKGQGVPRNYVRAYMWASLAAAQGVEESAKGVEFLEKEMAPAQIAEAQRLAREWTPKGE